MPTHIVHISDNIIEVTWIQPISESDLEFCFCSLQKLISGVNQNVHVLFDLRQAGRVPIQAPRLAIHSHFLVAQQLDKVVVVSTDVVTQVLAQIASRLSRHDIDCFSDYEDALNHLQNQANVG